MFDIDIVLLEMEEQAEKKIDHFEVQLSKISSGNANPAILKSVKVLYYEELTPLESIASISVPEAMQLLIKPFDHSSVRNVMAGLTKSGLDISPVNEGDKIRITFQPLTTERKRELAKSVQKFEEEAKIAIRLLRQNANQKITAQGESIGKDAAENFKEEVQKLTDKFNIKIAKIAEQKQKSIMKV